MTIEQLFLYELVDPRHKKVTLINLITGEEINFDSVKQTAQYCNVHLGNVLLY